MPTTPRHLYEWMAALSWTQSALARFLGVSEGTIRNVFAGRQQISPGWDPKLARLEAAVFALHGEDTPVPPVPNSQPLVPIGTPRPLQLDPRSVVYSGYFWTLHDPRAVDSFLNPVTMQMNVPIHRSRKFYTKEDALQVAAQSPWGQQAVPVQFRQLILRSPIREDQEGAVAPGDRSKPK